MLTPEYLRDAPEPLVRLYNQVAEDILVDMAERIAVYGTFGATAEFRMRKLRDMGFLQEDVIQKLSAMMGRSRDEIRAILRNAGVHALESDDKIYRHAGLSPGPIDASPALQAVLLTGMEQTEQLFENLTRTTAGTATRQFEQALDRAWLQVESGAFSHTEAARMAIKDLCRQGVQSITYPSGHTDSLDVAVRRAVLTGVNQTAARLQETRADELGCDLVEVSAHAGARTGIGVANHAEWQGKIYSRSGTHTKYPNFKEKTGYGTGPGLCGWNCRHNFSPYFEGAPRAYTEEMLKAYNEPKYEYNGKKLTEEEASKIQRYNERQLRRWKREYKAMEAAGMDTGEAAAKISEWQSRQKDFLAQTGFKRQHDRERVEGFGRSEGAKVAAVGRKINSYQSVVGAKTPGGTAVTSISRHSVERAMERGIPAPEIQRALTAPLKVGTIRADGTQQYIGEKATVVINPETGKIVTVWPTSTRKADKLKGGGPE